MDATWQLQWDAAGVGFVEQVVAASDLHWVTAAELDAITGQPRVWHRDHTGLVYELQLEDAQAALLTMWVRATPCVYLG